ncbi:MAG: glycosyltransferase family 2 protein [Planctomycetes bacterium]|nr:glycosyltransferase family 2 protein [Planctomycetota bacterium]
MFDVGCVLVNFNSGALCVSAVKSLLAQRFAGREGAQGTLQIVVVDNASPEDQHALLEPLAALGVEVIFHDVNLGYGGGINLGAARLDAEYLLLANPDILVLPGALDALVRRLAADARVGAAGPRGFLDAERFILLPPNDLPTLALHAVESLGRVHCGVARRTARRRSRRFFAAWRARQALDKAMVSGFAMLVRAQLARQLGPFDPGFPFYFEDADLCRRIRRAGYRLVLEPRAEMIHFFDQSARSVRAEVLEKYAVSRAYYYRKHYGAAGFRLYRAFDGYAARRGPAAEGWRFCAVEDLGDAAEPPLLAVPGGAREHVVEIATDPAFLFCGGHLGAGASVTLPRAAWDALEATRWYVRVLDARDLTILRCVTFQKTRPRAAPPTFEEFQALAAPSAGEAAP